MAKHKMEMAAGAHMMKGLKKKEPSSSDKSTKLKMTPSVNGEGRGIGTAPTPATLGPRTA